MEPLVGSLDPVTRVALATALSRCWVCGTGEGEPAPGPLRQSRVCCCRHCYVARRHEVAKACLDCPVPMSGRSP